MTLDELTHENRILQEQAIKLERASMELRLRIQENSDQIAKQLDDMNAREIDCMFCLGECGIDRGH